MAVGREWFEPAREAVGEVTMPVSDAVGETTPPTPAGNRNGAPGEAALRLPLSVILFSALSPAASAIWLAEGTIAAIPVLIGVLGCTICCWRKMYKSRSSRKTDSLLVNRSS